MTRKCSVCHHDVDIMQVYTKTITKSGLICKDCKKIIKESKKNIKPRINKNYIKDNTPMTEKISILLKAGYSKDYALSIINQGL